MRIAVSFAAVVLLAIAPHARAAEPADKPNVVFIICVVGQVQQPPAAVVELRSACAGDIRLLEPPVEVQVTDDSG